MQSLGIGWKPQLEGPNREIFSRSEGALNPGPISFLDKGSASLKDGNPKITSGQAIIPVAVRIGAAKLGTRRCTYAKSQINGKYLLSAQQWATMKTRFALNLHMTHVRDRNHRWKNSSISRSQFGPDANRSSSFDRYCRGQRLGERLA